MAVAALILGILGLLFCWFPASAAGIPLALGGLVLGGLSRRRHQARGEPLALATAAYVISVVALTLSLILTAVCSLALRESRRSLEGVGSRPAAERQEREFHEAVERAVAPRDLGPRGTLR